MFFSSSQFRFQDEKKLQKKQELISVKTWKVAIN